MAALEESRGAHCPSGRFALALFVLFVSLIAALIAVPVLAVVDLPVWLALLIPVVVLTATGFLWNTYYGLCFAAFAIAPLGIIEYEVASVTINLPEALILALTLKEGIRFLLRGERPVSFMPTRLFGCYIAASLLAVLTGVVRGNGLVANLQDFRQYTEYAVLYLLVLHRVATTRQIVQILTAFLLGMTLVALHGIVQRYTGLGVSLNIALSDAIFHGSIRSGSFYGATPLGGLMVLALGVGGGLFLFSRSWAWRGVLSLCLGVCITAAVFTKTRASWIAIAVCFLFVFLSIRKRPAVLIAAAVILVAFSVTLGPLVVQRMGTLEISRKEQSLLERVTYYRAAWHIFRAHPILGLGWGCEFSVRDVDLHGRYVPPPPRAQSLNPRLFGESTVHSAYLQVLARTGLVGLAAFLALIGYWFLLVLRERRFRGRDERVHNLFVGLAGALIGYLLHSSLENFFQWPVMSQSLWLILGLSTVLAAHMTSEVVSSG